MLLQATDTEKAIVRALVTQEGDSLTADEIGTLAFHQSGVTDAADCVRVMQQTGLISDRVRLGRYVLTPVGRWAARQLGIEAES